MEKFLQTADAGSAPSLAFDCGIDKSHHSFFLRAHHGGINGRALPFPGHPTCTKTKIPSQPSLRRDSH